jgi:hypothetical protein
MSRLDQVDHLVYATPDLDEAVMSLDQMLGVRASPGGRHPGRGTRNALLAIGPHSYLEIVGPDPEQHLPAHSTWFGIDDLKGPKLVTWAAKSSDLERVVDAARSGGVQLGPITSGSRQRSDGVTLTWQFTEPTVVQEDGILPFFIDWKSSSHPAANAAAGAELISFFGEHPEAERVKRSLAALGLDLEVRPAASPALVAVLRTARGEFQLR